MARYKEAIEWVAEMDDMSEIEENVPLDRAITLAPVTVVMISHLWNYDIADVIKDVRRAMKKENR